MKKTTVISILCVAVLFGASVASAAKVSESFETYADGAFTGNDFIKSRGVTIVSSQASDGQKALLMEDAGRPELIVSFQAVENTPLVASVDIMPIATEQLWVGLMDGNRVGPYLTFHADGRIYAVPGQEGSDGPGKSIPIIRYKAGTWYRVTIEVDNLASQTYSVSVKPLIGAETKKVDIPFRYRASKLNAMKIWHTKDGVGSDFIDNIQINISEDN